jgi:hypothetical protein
MERRRDRGLRRGLGGRSRSPPTRERSAPEAHVDGNLTQCVDGIKLSFDYFRDAATFASLVTFGNDVALPIGSSAAHVDWCSFEA